MPRLSVVSGQSSQRTKDNGPRTFQILLIRMRQLETNEEAGCVVTIKNKEFLYNA